MAHFFKLLILFSLLFSFNAHSKEYIPAVSFDMDRQKVSDVMRLIYIEAFKQRPYVLSDALLKDERLVSFRFNESNGSFFTFFKIFLNGLNYDIDRRNGVDFIIPLKESEKIEITKSIVEDTNFDLFIYRPKYRDSSYLREMLTPLFKGHFTSNRSIGKVNDAISSKEAPEGSLASQIDQNVDTLIFYSSKFEIKKLEELLSKIDTKIPEIFVEGVLYEVQKSENNQSAFQLLAKIINSTFQGSVGFSSEQGNYLSFDIGDFKAVVNALNSNSNFKVISNPSLRIKDGKTASFSVGEDVPVLGAVSYQNGQSVQSVDYKSSGILFNISPKIFDQNIDINVIQEISQFINTTTGLNNTPTLTKRKLETFVSSKNNDVLVLGGLKQSKNSDSKNSIPFLNWNVSKSFDKNESEIILLLNVKKI